MGKKPSGKGFWGILQIIGILIVSAFFVIGIIESMVKSGSILIVFDALLLGAIFSIICTMLFFIIYFIVKKMIYIEARLTDIEIRELTDFTLIIAKRDIKNLSIGYQNPSSGGYAVMHGCVKKGNAVISLSKDKITNIGGATKK